MTDKPSREDVLKMAGEPVGYVEPYQLGFIKQVGRCLCDIERYQVGKNTSPIYTEAQALAMYAAGADDMREQAIKEAEYFIRSDGLYIANAIRAIPITTNMEGEHG